MKSKPARISQQDLCSDICKRIRITRKNPDARQLSKRELLHLSAWIRLNTDKMTDMEHRIIELERSRRRK
jgi:hypothetical protein